jgi:hypothetical protein
LSFSGNRQVAHPAVTLSRPTGSGPSVANLSVKKLVGYLLLLSLMHYLTRHDMNASHDEILALSKLTVAAIADYSRITELRS